MITPLSSVSCYAPQHAKGIALTPSLSLLMPVFNAETTLRGEVEHLLELLPEFSERFEIIVVDDGSTDLTWEAAAELARTFPQVRTVRNEFRRGRNKAIATGRAETTAEIVLVMEENGSSQALRAQWLDFSEKESQATILPAIQVGAALLRPELVETLAHWGEAVNPASIPAPHVRTANSRVPASFMAHLKQLSRGE